MWATAIGGVEAGGSIDVGDGATVAGLGSRRSTMGTGAEAAAGGASTGTGAGAGAGAANGIAAGGGGEGGATSGADF